MYRPRIKLSDAGIAEFAKQLEPGDILMASAKPTRSEKPTERAFNAAFAAVSRYVQGSDKTHSMLYAGNGKVVETRIGTGARNLGLKDAISGLDVTALRPTGVSLKDRKAAARKAMELVKAKPGYAFKALANALLEEADVSSGASAADGIICSNLVTRSYDVPLTDKPKDAVLPVDFLRSTRLKQVAEHKGATA